MHTYLILKMQCMSLIFQKLLKVIVETSSHCGRVVESILRSSVLLCFPRLHYFPVKCERGGSKIKCITLTMVGAVPQLTNLMAPTKEAMAKTCKCPLIASNSSTRRLLMALNDVSPNLSIKSIFAITSIRTSFLFPAAERRGDHPYYQQQGK